MLLRIYWIEQIAFLHTSQATISALKNDVNLLRAMLHCVRAFTFEKTISTSTTKVQVSMRTWKNKTGLGNTIKRNFAHANSYNFVDKQHFKGFFDRVFRRPYRYFLPLSDRFEVFTTDDHWLILDWIAAINCLIKKF